MHDNDLTKIKRIKIIIVKILMLTIALRLNWVGRSGGNIKCWLSHVIARSNFCNNGRRIDRSLIADTFVSWNVMGNSLIFIRPK